MDARFDPKLPVIVLSGRGADAERVRGLEFGADDYLVKPFHYPELRARINAVLRRRSGRRDGPIRVGDLVVDPARRRALVEGRDVTLSNKEFSLLRVLASDPIRVFSKKELLAEVWGYRTRGADPHPGLAREPAASQTRPGAQPLRDQLLGRRLSPRRRMTGLGQALLGWTLAATMVAVTAAVLLRSGRQRTAINEALHELRRPLQALALSEPSSGAARSSRARRGWPPRPSSASIERSTAAEARRRPSRCAAKRCCAPRSAAGGRGWRSAAARWSCAGGPARRSSLGDRAALEQAVDNLIVNAIEHGGPEIVVEGRCRAGRLLIFVGDSGRGPARARARADGDRRSAGSRDGRRRGHGLAVVRRVAADHRGRFVLQRGGEGALAMLDLPLAGDRSAGAGSAA